jgi:hypothetical protein
VIAIAVRFLPHPLSFTPIGAALLFFGAKKSPKQMWIQLAMLAVTDVVLTKVVYGYPFSADHYVTWAWYALALGIGTLLSKNDGLLRVAGASLGSSISFFLISNAAVWAVWNMYPKTLGGLAMSYVAGLPFFRNTVVSDMIFAVAFFSIPVAIELLSGKTAKEKA